MDIQAVIYGDGSMYVTQVRNGSFDEGTESYIPMNASDYLTISQLTVSDQNGSYETVPEWNIDWSFEEKAKKCGIHDTDSGYEICFGISNYGRNRYAIEYKLDNVIGAYSDRDGVNFRFVNDGMNATPTDVKVEIRLADGTPITDETADKLTDLTPAGEQELGELMGLKRYLTDFSLIAERGVKEMPNRARELSIEFPQAPPNSHQYLHWNCPVYPTRISLLCTHHRNIHGILLGIPIHH